MQRSFTIDVMPDTEDDKWMRVVVKTVDLEDNRWVNTKIWLERLIVCDSEGIPDADTLTWIAALTRRVARLVETEIDRQEIISVSETDAQPKRA